MFANQAGTAGTATSANSATSASHALFANQAGTATSATSANTATSASHALFANQAGSATTATTATTASYIDPTFISASAAASGFGSGGGSGLVAGTGTNSLASALTTTPAIAGGVGSISIGNSSFSNSTASIAIGVNSQIGTLADGAINIGSGSISANCNASIAIGKGSNVASNRSNVIAIGVNASAGAEGVAIGQGANGVLVSGNDGQTVAIGKNATANGRYAIAIGNGATASDINGISIGNVFKFDGTSTIGLIGQVSSSVGFIGNGSGLTNINTAFGAELYYNAADYVIDLPGDFNDPAVTVSISQSGVYLISSSKVPPYGTNGPRVNLQWCPQQLGSGVAKVKFFIPSLDTGNGVSYKSSVSCSADYQYIWNSTVTPSGSTTTTLARSLTLPQYSNGTGVTNMIKGQDGYVYFSTTSAPVPSQGYIYTGPSLGLLV